MLEAERKDQQLDIGELISELDKLIKNIEKIGEPTPDTPTNDPTRLERSKQRFTIENEGRTLVHNNLENFLLLCRGKDEQKEQLRVDIRNAGFRLPELRSLLQQYLNKRRG